MKKAFVVVFEGNSGSGKETQFKLAKTRAEQEGLTIASFDFPRYGQVSARPIEEYLRGEKRYAPYDAAVLYANDRLAVREALWQAVNTKGVVFINRYVSSNFAYQGAGLTNPDEQAALIAAIEQLEYEQNKLPRPDLTLFLAVEPRVAQAQVDKKGERSYINGRDIHEADLNLEMRAAKIYKELSETRDDYQEIFCMQDEETMRSREDIHSEIWELISRHLKNNPQEDTD
ncbi:MAG TPA: hypothetical protein VD907_03020 [Verrucomicrobiae bacterium]|nr:hypothetical protein [Verrucomicrobiae bacterium]